MRVPSSPSSTPKSPSLSLSNNNNNNNNNNTNTALNIALHTTPSLCYEPTSVLDLCRSPSPAPAAPPLPDHSAASKPADATEESSLELEDHVLHSLDWDSIMKDLGLHDQLSNLSHFHPSHDPLLLDHSNNSTAPPDFTDIYSNHPNPSLGYPNNFNNGFFDHLVNNNDFNNQNNGFDFIEILIRAADCFDSNQLHLAHAILDRLNQRLRSPIGKPLQRAAFYFKDALLSLLSGSNRTTTRVSSLLEIVHAINAFKAFSGISPIPMFSIFTTNQALLEAFHGSRFMHVIDFDIGLGIQYASLMKEIAEKAAAEASKIHAPPPLLRITALVSEEYGGEYCKLIRENLNQFAVELRIRVQVEFVSLQNFEAMSFKAVNLADGEKTAVLLSPAIFRRLGSANSVAAFVADVRRVAPSVVIFVDGEGWTEASATASFRKGVVSSLEFYSMMLESLDASTVVGGDSWVRRIEMLVLRPKMTAAVEGAGRMVTPWREVFYGGGMRPVQLSQFADFQAQCLLAKVQIRGFHVAKRQAELVLFWHQRPMVATSAWRW